MILGIVGSEAAKFTELTELQARVAIRRAIKALKPDLVVSGRCPLGGIDIWAIEEAKRAGIPTKEYPPRTRSWATGYKPRNLQIAQSDHVVCITVKELPEGYTGMRFALCYHCAKKKGGPREHVKSGGCWTAWQCKSRSWVVIE